MIEGPHKYRTVYLWVYVSPSSMSAYMYVHVYSIIIIFSACAFSYCFVSVWKCVCGCGDDTGSQTVKHCEQSDEAWVFSEMLPSVTSDHHKSPNSLIPVSNRTMLSCAGNSQVHDCYRTNSTVASQLKLSPVVLLKSDRGIQSLVTLTGLDRLWQNFVFYRPLVLW